MDPLLLARIQFASNISFHILFPSISIALSWVLLYFKWRYRRTQDERWMDAYRLWVKIFALTFAMGVVSGVTMSFQFGTNWPGFMETVGNVAGPLLAYEVLTAFFLEATFLAIMLFGIGKVSERVHTLATVLVAVGTAVVGVLDPGAGFVDADPGRLRTDRRARACHRLAGHPVQSVDAVARHPHAAGIGPDGGVPDQRPVGVAGVAWRYPAGRAGHTAHRGHAGRGAIPLQILVGDFHGLNTLEHQPAKIAAMEGIWHTETGAPLLLFAWPDAAEQRNHLQVAIPHGASLILRHSAEGRIQGLDQFPDAHPPVRPVFFAFRVMVGMGLLMLAVSWFGAWRLRGGRSPPRWWLKAMVGMTFAGWVATLAGWYVTEIGRQPWLVYGLLRTAAAATARPIPLGTSLTLYLVLYASLIFAYISVLFYLARKGGTAGVPHAT